MIATSQPLASAAGLRVLQQGGNAIDAAVTAAAVLVGRRTDDERYRRRPVRDRLRREDEDAARAECERTRAGRGHAGRVPRRGLDAIPYRGALSVSVPGVVDGWSELLEQHGTITLDHALEPAIALRARRLRRPRDHRRPVEGRRADPGAATRRPPRRSCPAAAPRAAGEVFRNPQPRRDARADRAGRARRVLQGADRAGHRRRHAAPQGAAHRADFAAHRSDWVEPISTTYRGYDVFEMPPNTQGVVALEMLNILEGFDLKSLGHNSAEYLHLLVEAKRIAFADRDA